MASLTDTLPTNNYQKPVIATEVKQPDYFGAVADLGKAVIGVQADAQQAEARRASAQRQAAEEARAEYRFNREVNEDAATNAFARGHRKILSDMELAEARKLKSGVDSGNMDPTSYNIRLNKLLVDIEGRYPDAMDAVMDELRENGLHGAAFTEFARAETMRKAADEAKSNEYTTYMKAFTDMALPGQAGLTDQEKLEIGREELYRKRVQTESVAQLEAEMKKAELGEKVNTARIKKFERDIADSAVKGISLRASPVVNELLQLTQASGGAGFQATKELTEAGQNALNYLSQLELELDAQLAFITDEGERNRAKSVLNNLKATAQSAIDGDLSRLKAQTTMLDFVKTSNKVLGYESFPEAMRMVDTFGPTAMGHFFQMATTQMFVNNPGMTERLADGMTDLVNGTYDTEGAQAALKFMDDYNTNAKDNSNINSMGQQEAQEVIKTRSLSIQDTQAAFLEDPENLEKADLFLDDFMSLSYAAGQVAPNTANMDYVENVHRVFASSKLSGAIDRLEKVSPGRAKMARINLATSLAVAVEAGKSQIVGHDMILPAGSPLSTEPVIMGGYGSASVSVGAQNIGIEYNADKGVFEPANLQGGKLTKESQVRLDKLNHMMSVWFVTEEKLGSLPTALKTPKEKREFLATSNISPEVAERFNEAQVATQNGGNRDATLDAIRDFNARVTQASLTMAAEPKMKSYVRNTLSEVRAKESNNNYDALLGHSQNSVFLDKKVTEMTLGELKTFSKEGGEYANWSKEWKEKNSHGDASVRSTPMGAYQIVGTTLARLQKEMNLSDDTVFTPEVQDRMGEWLLEELLVERRPLGDEWEAFKE